MPAGPEQAVPQVGLQAVPQATMYYPAPRTPATTPPPPEPTSLERAVMQLQENQAGTNRVLEAACRHLEQGQAQQAAPQQLHGQVLPGTAATAPAVFQQPILVNYPPDDEDMSNGSFELADDGRQ